MSNKVPIPRYSSHGVISYLLIGCSSPGSISYLFLGTSSPGAISYLFIGSSSPGAMSYLFIGSSSPGAISYLFIGSSSPGAISYLFIGSSSPGAMNSSWSSLAMIYKLCAHMKGHRPPTSRSALPGLAYSTPTLKKSWLKVNQLNICKT